jgi:cytochrome c551/c552
MFPRAMLFGLATSHKIGLAAMGAAFIIFALVSSFVLPARDPNFPGKNLRWYIVVCVAFFVAMMASILILAKEKPEAEAAGGEEPAAGSTEAPGPAATGDAAAGKIVFTKGPCGSCHKFTPAGTTGAVGPDLGKLKESADAAGKPLAEFTKESITDPDAYVPSGYQKGVMPPNGGATLSPKELDDLVAFLDEGQ